MTVQTARAGPEEVFVARQPIFDADRRIFGYELLFRSGFENHCNNSDGDASTMDVIVNSFLIIGFDELSDGRRGFLNFTRNLLLDGTAALLPNDMIVVEILEDVEPDQAMLDACRKLKDSGYMLAMDDFVLEHVDSPLIDLVDIVKVDFLALATPQRQEICETLVARGVKVLAEKVETAREFDQAKAWGCSYFQGYFFCDPVVRTGRRIGGNRLAHARILAEVNQTGMSYDKVEALIKQTPTLVYSLLRLMNSSWFGFRQEIRSIKHALVLLGPQETRKWISLLALRNLTEDKPNELVLLSLTRARLAESLAPLVGVAVDGSKLFLVGMFSVLDALTDPPMDEAVERIPLDSDIKTALTGGQCALRTVYDLILAYERGRWDEFSHLAGELRLDETAVPRLFTESVHWARQILKTA